MRSLLFLFVMLISGVSSTQSERLSFFGKKIPLFSSVPVEPYTIQLFSDTTIKFYFDKKEWKSELDKLPGNSNEKVNYVNYLDSLTKIEKIIHIAGLPNDPRQDKDLFVAQ